MIKWKVSYYFTAIAVSVLIGMLIAERAGAFEGRYRTKGDPDWEYEQSLSIERKGNRYLVELGVGSRNCAGQVAALATRRGRTLVTTRGGETRDRVDRDVCRLTLTRAGKHLIINEHECGFHGDRCEFAGTYFKR